MGEPTFDYISLDNFSLSALIGDCFTKSTQFIVESERRTIVAKEQYIDRKIVKVSSEHLKNATKSGIKNEARFNVFTVYTDLKTSLGS